MHFSSPWRGSWTSASSWKCCNTKRAVFKKYRFHSRCLLSYTRLYSFELIYANMLVIHQVPDQTITKDECFFCCLSRYFDVYLSPPHALYWKERYPEWKYASCLYLNQLITNTAFTLGNISRSFISERRHVRSNLFSLNGDENTVPFLREDGKLIWVTLELPMSSPAFSFCLNVWRRRSRHSGRTATYHKSH